MQYTSLFRKCYRSEATSIDRPNYHWGDLYIAFCPSLSNCDKNKYVRKHKNLTGFWPLWPLIPWLVLSWLHADCWFSWWSVDWIANTVRRRTLSWRCLECRRLVMLAKLSAMQPERASNLTTTCSLANISRLAASCVIECYRLIKVCRKDDISQCNLPREHNRNMMRNS